VLRKKNAIWRFEKQDKKFWREKVEGKPRIDEKCYRVAT